MQFILFIFLYCTPYLDTRGLETTIKISQRGYLFDHSQTLSQKNGVETLQRDGKVLKEKGGFTKIIKLGAALAPK